nr:Bro-N domain-containing protein [Nostoc sp. EfeVER01]MDZ7944330.1 Bro-N domain-containing protein [Nostoc sp. EfeVER01]
MASLSVFSFESHEIRFVGTADEPWWVASDLCVVLDIVNVSQAIAKLDDDEKLMYTLQISGQGRETLCINESGLYSLVLTSRKPQAKRFRKWLTSEVIPAIRKTGTYSAIAKPQPSLPSQAQKAKLTKHHARVAVDLHPTAVLIDHVFDLSYIY